MFALRRSLIVCAALLSSTALRADFSYLEITRSGKRVVRTKAISIKGNRMFERVKDRGEIINLENDTITEIDFAKKTYSVIPFAQRKIESQPIAFQISKKTGETQKIGVLQGRETILNLTAEDKLTVTLDAWFITVPGYDEARAFQRKLGERLWYGFGLEAPTWAQPGISAAIQELLKLDGAPVERTLKIVSGADEFESVIELDDLGSAPADSLKFEVPTAFKKIEIPASIPPQNPPTATEAPK